MSNILVTGIGGVVGQGILRNARLEFPSLGIIGTNTKFLSVGNHLCDQVYQVPVGDAPTYVGTIQEIVAKHHIELIIPSTDLEGLFLGLNRKSIGCKVACSDPKTTEMCLDKYKTFGAFKKAGIPFAESRLPSQFQGDFERTIVKPRQGRGSRGISVNPNNIEQFDDTYVVQELAVGQEITTAFYVKAKNELHGMITFKRELDAGNTSMAEVTMEFDHLMKPIVFGMIRSFDFTGSVNVQSIVEKDEIVPFEINCRISGTNSIRSHFGFKDVKYTIQEHLLGQDPDPVAVKLGSAMRVITDLIYPGKKLDEIRNHSDEFESFG